MPVPKTVRPCAGLPRGAQDPGLLWRRAALSLLGAPRQPRFGRSAPLPRVGQDDALAAIAYSRACTEHFGARRGVRQSCRLPLVVALLLAGTLAAAQQP